jgi:hypothetical protein
MISPHGDTTSDNETSTILDRREAQRVSLHSRVLYRNDEDTSQSAGKGWLQNLSKKGCHITGSLQVVAGSTVTISLDLDDGKAPLCLPGATVCWSDGLSFGVRFPPMTLENRQRLQELVLKFATLRGISQAHTAFRIA